MYSVGSKHKNTSLASLQIGSSTSPAKSASRKDLDTDYSVSNAGAGMTGLSNAPAQTGKYIAPALRQRISLSMGQRQPHPDIEKAKNGKLRMQYESQVPGEILRSVSQTWQDGMVPAVTEDLAFEKGLTQNPQPQDKVVRTLLVRRASNARDTMIHQEIMSFEDLNSTDQGLLTGLRTFTPMKMAKKANPIRMVDAADLMGKAYVIDLDSFIPGECMVFNRFKNDPENESKKVESTRKYEFSKEGKYFTCTQTVDKPNVRIDPSKFTCDRASTDFLNLFFDTSKADLEKWNAQSQAQKMATDRGRKTKGSKGAPTGAADSEAV